MAWPASTGTWSSRSDFEVIWTVPSRCIGSRSKSTRGWGTWRAWPASTGTWASCSKLGRSGRCPSRCIGSRSKSTRGWAAWMAWPVSTGTWQILAQVRGDLDGAEQMHRKSLEIDERLGRLDGMASQYGNLGILLQLGVIWTVPSRCIGSRSKSTRGWGTWMAWPASTGTWASCSELGVMDGAEQMHRKSLEINERLGRLEGMATEYGNLGLVLLKLGVIWTVPSRCTGSRSTC